MPLSGHLWLGGVCGEGTWAWGRTGEVPDRVGLPLPQRPASQDGGCPSAGRALGRREKGREGGVETGVPQFAHPPAREVGESRGIVQADLGRAGAAWASHSLPGPLLCLQGAPSSLPGCPAAALGYGDGHSRRAKV